MHYDACPLGHAKLETTALYTRVAVNTVRDIKSPFERLNAVRLASLTQPRPLKATHHEETGAILGRSIVPPRPR